jgi:hypothetical protein
MKLKDIIEGNGILKEISNVLNRIHIEGPVHPEDFERLAYFKKFHNPLFSLEESKLIHLIGLFYKVNEPTNFLEEVYSIYADSIYESTGSNFTPTQASAFRSIHEKTYFSFSAPTSSGKSFLFRELIQNAKGDIVIIVPSRALIAEYMHAVIQLVDKSVLVLQFLENINKSKIKRRIYIITPERGGDLFKLINELNIELFLFDEAQISEDDLRGMRFDAFVRRADKLIPHAKKVFTHPFVQNPEAQLKKHSFKENAGFMRYDQNAVGKIYITIKEDQHYYFSPYTEENEIVMSSENIVEEKLKNNGTLLIYTSKSKIYDGSYIDDFAKYISLCPKLSNPDAVRIIDELRDFIGASEKSGDKHSVMIDMMEKGIVVHHGSIPLKARLLIENFVNDKHARICFATSTLTQGINMPFDVVWINNFHFQGSEDQKNLDLKNLIGRAGRSTKTKNIFDYGYVIIEEKNVRTFCTRIKSTSSLSETSFLEHDISTIPDDSRDIAEAIKGDSFNNELQLTESQIARVDKANIRKDIQRVLDALIVNNESIQGADYYKITTYKRKKIKESFAKIFAAHMRRRKLFPGEKAILSASISMLLWQIQGKSFKEIISLRHAYLTVKSDQRLIDSKLKAGTISKAEADELRKAIKIKFSQPASALPNADATILVSLFKKKSVLELDYDILVYDTYDYIDKVISLSLKDPLAAAFQLYFDKTKDNRALIMRNYIKYGTNDDLEIWLLRYGFGFEDIEWIRKYVVSIDESQIVFSPSIQEVNLKQHKVIERFI